jgi:glycosyltransferase involved in cell wall biosynthesis
MALKGKVSIIVPYYNSREYLRRLIDSIRSQTHTNFECILVDDGSKDDSFGLVETLIEGDPRFSNKRRPDGFLPGGRGAKNHGYSFTDGEFIVFFDSDDVMHSDYLRDRVAYLSGNPRKDAVVSDFGWRVTPGGKKRIFRYNRALFVDFTKNAKEDWFWLNYLDYRFFFSPGNPMWRRSSIDDKPLWDETTSIGEDYEYHARLMLAGLDIGIIDGVHYDLMANTSSMIATSESLLPLLSRSYGKMLVIEGILKHLGHRDDILKKELTCQVKILRRIVACDSDPEKKKEAVKTMLSRIEWIMDQLKYPIARKSLLSHGLRTVAKWHGRTGKFHRLYSILVKDGSPTTENAYFTIA